jgi:hypothetical protein
MLGYAVPAAVSIRLGAEFDAERPEDDAVWLLVAVPKLQLDRVG